MPRKTRSDKKPRVVRHCEFCNMRFEFQDAPSNARRRFCSVECRRRGCKVGPEKKPRTPHVCKLCGKVFIDEHAERPRRFCSNKCHAISKRRKNHKHPRGDLAADLQKWAREVILRDEKCIRCGVQGPLQAHHINSYAKHPELRLDISNGAALCPVCHHAQHPKHELGWFLGRGGRSVSMCVICEGKFVASKNTQRTCSVSCGAKSRQSKRNYKLGGYSDA